MGKMGTRSLARPLASFACPPTPSAHPPLKSATLVLPFWIQLKVTLVCYSVKKHSTCLLCSYIAAILISSLHCFQTSKVVFAPIKLKTARKYWIFSATSTLREEVEVSKRSSQPEQSNEMVYCGATTTNGGENFN